MSFEGGNFDSFESLCEYVETIDNVEEKLWIILSDKSKEIIQNRIDTYHDSREEIADLLSIEERVIKLHFKKYVAPTVKTVYIEDPSNIKCD